MMNEAAKYGFYHWNPFCKTATHMEHEQPQMNLVCCLFVLGVLGLFCHVLWSTRPLNRHSTSIAWLTKWKFTNTMKTSETKCNSRNKGINHTIKHTNALKWLPNTYEFSENMTFIIPPCLNLCLSSCKH